MPEFIEPVVDKVLSVLAARTPALLVAQDLTAFAETGKQWTGAQVNFPGIWVSPVRTEFDTESTDSHQAHQIRIKFGVAGSEPDDLALSAERYMAAIHQALAASWPGDWVDTLAAGVVVRLYVRMHDYGPLFERDGMLAKWPEMDLVVETRENWDTGVEGV